MAQGGLKNTQTDEAKKVPFTGCEKTTCSCYLNEVSAGLFPEVCLEEHGAECRNVNGHKTQNKPWDGTWWKSWTTFSNWLDVSGGVGGGTGCFIEARRYRQCCCICLLPGSPVVFTAERSPELRPSNSHYCLPHCLLLSGQCVCVCVCVHVCVVIGSGPAVWGSAGWRLGVNATFCPD